ncbi:golvesin C-terminal-like domain-containing protein [Streptomyces sp. NPDC054933]
MTAAPDSDGLHLLAADSKTAYTWKTAAVLNEPGMPADTWIGNQCLIDHDHAAVAYAPRAFTNHPDTMLGGAFTAIVDLNTGAITKLPFTASLAYFDPSCNSTTRTAAFTAFRDSKTHLVTVDTSGHTVADTTAQGQVTSPVPTRDGVIAALGNRLVHIDRKGSTTTLAATSRTPYDIHALADGKIAFLDRIDNSTTHAKTYSAGKVTTIATGKLEQLALKQAGTSSVFLTGHPTGLARLTGSGLTALNAPVDADISTTGHLAVTPVVSDAVQRGLDQIKGAGKHFAKTTEPAPQRTPGHITHAMTISGVATTTGRTTAQIALPPAKTARAVLSPALTGSTQPKTLKPLAANDTSIEHNPIDTDRWCSVPRNDVNEQALQPTPNQVEWAVDMAIRGDLHAGNLTQGGWRAQTGIGTIDPQGMFPKPSLNGGGNIPAQVELGILAQESNLWQAESGSIAGQMGNPLASLAGFYGHKSGGSVADYWKIDWTNSDCGYGVGQVTDGMRIAGHEKTGETALPPEQQKAVALDYASNVAASLKILADKWNEVHTDGQKVTVNNDDPSRPENWFTAVWNYNLGFNAPGAPSSPWGLGWYNNPANPVYPPSRLAFMDTSLDRNANHDAAHPQDWPYEEKVMGWAAWSIDTGFSYATSGRQDWPGESGFSSAGFNPAWWLSPADRSLIKPPLDTFCNIHNGCDVTNPPHCPNPDCYKQYWWNQPNTVWKDNCNATCGHESIKYQTLANEPGRGYRLKDGTPDCSAPTSGALVVDSVPNGTQTWGACGAAASDGSFQFTFYQDTDKHYEAKGDLHQVGGGYQGHYWYARDRNADHLGGDGGPMAILGDWKLGKAVDHGQAKVYVHIPDTGAQTKEAVYQIVTPFGTVKKAVDQSANESNKWVSLGAYRFKDQLPEVKLSNANSSGTADKDIAWDAVAFVPGDYSGMPHITFPNPDDNAPMPGWQGDPIEAHRNTGVHTRTNSPNSVSPTDKGLKCSKPNNKGSKVCMGFGKAQTGKSKLDSFTAKAVHAGSIDTIVPWCDNYASGKDYFTRTDACLKAISPLMVIWVVNDKVVGTASFAMKQEIKLYNNLPEFDQLLTLVPVNIDAALGAVTLRWNAAAGCDDCTQSPQVWDGAMTWAGPNDTHTANGKFQTMWNGTNKESITLGWGITGQISAYPSATGEADLGNTLGDLDLRCDNTTKGATNAGCIFPKYTPTYTVNTNRYPAAGAYYWLMKEKNSNHLGSKAHNTPLHYLADGQTDNRAIVCPSSWVGRSETPEASCDEYAFATTHESGGVPNSGITSGDQCAQFYAKPLDNTTWTLLDDDRFDLPNWSEKCGRASIPLAQNTGALAPFGRTGGFVPYNRMLDEDAFWLATPGFDHCTESDTSCTFRRTNS